MDQLKCGCCKLVKPVEEFHRCATRRSGYVSRCKACQKQKSHDWHKSRSPEVKAAAAQRQRVWRNQSGRFEQSRAYRLKIIYGLSVEAYEQLIAAQNGLCAICTCEMSRDRGSPVRMCVDHDHKTGKIRGILCRRCNIGIGHLQDSLVLLQAAIRYLERNQVAVANC